MKAYKEVCSSDAGLFFKELKTDCNYKHIFRGQPDPKWAVNSSLSRKLLAEKKLINSKAHTKITEKYKVTLKKELNLKGGTFYDKPFYHLLQHYGAPTNLLDWTMDPDMALYFSIFKTEPNEECEKILKNWGGIQRFCLYCMKINSEMVDKKQADHEEGCLSVYDPMNFLLWNKEDAKHHKEIYSAPELKKLNERMQNQKGLFTYHSQLDGRFCVKDYFQNRKANEDYQDNNIRLDTYLVEIDVSNAMNLFNEFHRAYHSVFSASEQKIHGICKKYEQEIRSRFSYNR